MGEEEEGGLTCSHSVVKGGNSVIKGGNSPLLRVVTLSYCLSLSFTMR